MHLKRFRRETVQDALRAAREELGASALVLSTRMVAAPGLRGLFGARYVEVTAAAERPQVSDLRHFKDSSAGALAQAAARELARRAAAVRDGGRSGDDAEAAVAAKRRATTRKARKPNDDRAVASLAAQLQATGLDA